MVVVFEDFPTHLQLLVMCREQRHEPHEMEGGCRGGGTGDQCIFFIGVRQAISSGGLGHLPHVKHFPLQGGLN